MNSWFGIFDATNRLLNLDLVIQKTTITNNKYLTDEQTTNKWQKKVAYFCDALKELGLFLLSGPYFFEKYIDRGINHGCEKLLNTTCCRCLGEQENTVEMLAHEWFSLTPSLWTKSQICTTISHPAQLFPTPLTLILLPGSWKICRNLFSNIW